jgi:hydrocephalus-inducing protein
VTTVAPEPEHRTARGSRPKDIALKAFIVSDQIRCTIDQAQIAFAPTMMFQSRTAEFRVTNTCQIRLEYQWIVTRFEAARSAYAASWPCPFSIEPQSGVIEAGQATIFRAIFAPMEVDDFVASFGCHVLYMSQGEPPAISMSGLSRRPLCHFNVALSDYLSRRHPDFNYPLPEGTRAIELFSRAIRVKTPKKLEIVNPTASPYEAQWSLILDNSDGAITCEHPVGLVSSGKHYFVSFNFTPTSARLVESLWEFTVPAHGLKVAFLFIGRLSH